MIRNKLKLRCTNDFRVFKPVGDTLIKMKTLGYFEEGEGYEATLEPSLKQYFVISSSGNKVYPAFIDDNGELVVEEGWELVK